MSLRCPQPRWVMTASGVSTQGWGTGPRSRRPPPGPHPPPRIRRDPGRAEEALLMSTEPTSGRGPGDGVPRHHLPIPSRPFVGATPYDAKASAGAFPPITRLRPPEGAPNVLVILLDDVGFGAAGTFGGPCRTPTADRLASGGARCKPSP